MGRTRGRAWLVVVSGSSAIALSSLLLRAERAPTLPAIPYRYAAVALPAHFTSPGPTYDNTPPDNPLTDHGATLGRVLFYDTRLSANDTTSCASCHVQAHAFADPQPFSRGFHGARTDRRAMPLVNVRYYQRARFFWDERAHALEQMVLLPITSRVEMGQDLERLVDTLSRDATYPVLFARAFGDREVTAHRIGKALAQFVRAIVSYRSRYDEGRGRAQSADDDFDNFTRQENRGKALFLRNCATCHMNDGNEHFFVNRPANTGLQRNDPTADTGVADMTLRFGDVGSFKSPSLRNVEVTAPYGHDGRFATLGAVIDHYSDTPIEDPNLGYMAPRSLQFTPSEKAALIAFLKTLTDPTCLTDPGLSNPFAAENDGTFKRLERTVLPAAAVLVTMGAAASHAPMVLRSALHVAEPTLPLPPSAPSHFLAERLLSFDTNADHRISRRELPERMEALVGRGDRNGDAALDPGEIRDLVNVAALLPSPPVPIRPQHSAGLRGVIADLKLPPARHAAALALISGDVRGPFHDVAGSNVNQRLRALLDDEEYSNFVAAAARLFSGFRKPR